MTAIAAEVTVTPDEATRIEQARGVLSRARADSFDWPHTERSRRAVTMAASDLEEALEFHGNLLSGALHPASEFPQLAARHPDDALAQALALATGEITDCASALVIIVRRECSEEMAVMVSGQDRPVAA
jgi:hypothetical protein